MIGSLTEDSMTIEEFRQLEREHPPRRLQVGDFTVVLDRPCTRCRGTGKDALANPYARCAACNDGRVLTEEGRIFIEFARDWIGRPEKPAYPSHVPGTNQPEGIQYGRHS